MIGDRYILGELFKQGAQAKIWKALDKITGARRIIKTGSGVKQEALLSRRLVHPLIGYAYDCGLDPEHGDYSVYPEFLGKNALEWIGDRGNGTLKQFALKASEFLCFLHHRGWLYNDFKPEHFLMTENGLKVIDLGLCTPLKDESVSSTFSGTFPYISPERLNGRSFDQRSDIFALGILLLHLLLPNEKFPSEPSLEALNTLLYKVNKLKEPWKKTISQMTALEPSQRISNASELIKALPSAKERFLAHPAPAGSFSLPSDLTKEKLLYIHSQSQARIDLAHDQLLVGCWEHADQVYSFDCKQISPEHSFEKLCVASGDPAGENIYSMLQMLERKRNPSPTVIIYRNPEFLGGTDRAMLFFGLSCLREIEWIRIALLSTKPSLSKITNQWRKIVVPLSDRESSLPESFESINPASRKILNALALAGGSLPLSFLELPRHRSILQRLEQNGYLQTRYGLAFLASSPEAFLTRLRKTQRASAANRILKRHRAILEPLALFHLAQNAGENRLAAKAALKLARASQFAKRKDRLEWYWNAFVCNANLPAKILFRMSKYFLQRMNRSRVKRLLRHIRLRFGKSFRYADLYIDYLFQTYKLDQVNRIINECIDVSKRRNNQQMYEYFRLRMAGLYIFRNEFNRAEEILDAEITSERDSVIGLRHHYRGLLLFHRGNLPESLNHYQQSYLFPNRFGKGHGAMNIGVVLGKMGRFTEAQKSLNQAILIFSRSGDQEGLCRAFINLGMNFLSAGEVMKARRDFIRCIHLSRFSRNPSIYLGALNNLSVTYEMEGRNEKAILILSRVYRFALKFRLYRQASFALSNTGLHLAYTGQFRKAVSVLKEAIRLRSSLKLKSIQARTYEYLGITYYLAGRLKSAEESFQTAVKMFLEAGSPLDRARTQFLLSLVYLQKNDLLRSREILQKPVSAPENSFEMGIYLHAQAILFHISGDQRNALRFNQDAERVFRKAPSLYWLARNHKLKSEIYRSIENFEKVFLSLQAAYHLFSRLGARHELKNLPKEGGNMQLYQDFMDRLADRLPHKALEMIREILSVNEVDRMVEKILYTALDLTSMDRALLVLEGDPPRVFRSASMDESNLNEILEVSRAVLLAARDSGKPVVCLDALSDPLLQNRPSILNNRILSVVCLPLRGPNGQPVGSLYLDSCEGVETLAGTEKIMLEIFSSIIGLVLSQSLVLEKSIQENRKLRNWLEIRKECPEMIGTSQAVSNVLRIVQKVINHNLPVLITGETGTGKELVARILHYSGSRKKGPFVAVNCAAFSKDLLESELFGHEKGSFTGAFQQKKGVFEQAFDGTLLLDEIGEMPLEMQAKLLRVLQGGEYRRIGGATTLSTNARIVLATNRNIEELVVQRTFREDLLYRIKVVEIHLPALRDRVEDISLLAIAFLKEAMVACDKRFLGFTVEAMSILRTYSWPGNIRQLKSVVERAAALTDDDWIDVGDLDENLVQTVGKSEVPETSGSLAEIEKSQILSRLEKCDWNVASAAKSLGITRHGLYSKMKRYRVTNPKKA